MKTEKKLTTVEVIFYNAILVGIIVLIIWGISSCINSKPRAENGQDGIIESRLSYLKQKLPEISRIEFVGNDVFISFSGDKLPADYQTVCKFAAVHGSSALKDRKTITRCSVWVIPEAAKTGDVGKVYYNANARDGSIY